MAFALAITHNNKGENDGIALRAGIDRRFQAPEILYHRYTPSRLKNEVLRPPIEPTPALAAYPWLEKSDVPVPSEITLRLDQSIILEGEPTLVAEIGNGHVAEVMQRWSTLRRRRWHAAI